MQSTLRNAAAVEEPKGSWYGLVFGVDEPSEGEPKHTADEYIEYNARGQLKVGTTQNQQVRNFFYKVCNQLVKFGEILVSFHDGYTDRNCGFHGFHWHVYCHARLHPTSDARWGKELQSLARASPPGEKMYLAAMAARSHALLKHIIKPPRVVKWFQGAEMTDLVETLRTDLEKEQVDPDAVDWDPAKLKSGDRNVGRIKVLTQLMEKYATIANNVLRNKMLKEDNVDEPDSDWNKYVQILATPNFEQLYKKAVTIMKSTYLSKKIVKLFDLPLNTKDPKYIPLGESVKLFSRWCEFQSIDEAGFMQELFDVLMCKVPKLNSFVIQGAPNAGKSFILRSLLPWYRWWGEIRLDTQGYAFAFENAVDVGVIFIEEPVITPIAVEQMKMIMEGAETYVKCKRIGDELVLQTPVLITHNDDLYRFVSSIDKAALMTRMFKYTCKSCPFLKDYNKLLNPGIWPILYRLHGLDVDELMSDETNIPTVQEQLALEEEGRTRDFDRTEISTEEIAEIFPEPLAKRICLPQTDGPFDYDEDDDRTRDEYQEKVETLKDVFTQFMDGTFSKMDTDVMENRAVHEWVYRNMEVDLHWKEAAMDDLQINALKNLEQFWNTKQAEATKDKWAFIQNIHKIGNMDLEKQHELNIRTDKQLERYYPIMSSMASMIHMIHTFRDKLRKIAVAEVAADMAHEKEVASYFPELEGLKVNVPPGAPKAKRSRSVNRSEVDCAKKLKFEAE